MPTLADVVAVLDELYDPRTAEPWDAVGLVCGDPRAPVGKVLFAVDPVEAVAEEALEWGADLIVTHHPLYLRGTSSVAATTPKGRLVHRLISSGVALHCVHTNGDSADPGVSDSLAAALGVRDLRPLSPASADALDKLVVFVPVENVEALLDALSAAGAGRLGDYERAGWFSEGTGTFLPRDGANPAIGSVGSVEQVREARLEMLMPRSSRAAVLAALRSAHPYEEPAYDVLEPAAMPGRRGLGRVGRLERPQSLREFVDTVARALPATAAGVRAAGDPERRIETVAVCGGAGDSLLTVARQSGADAYVTADLRHHPASEAADGPALIDVAHWASEWPWLTDAAVRMTDALAARGTTVETKVSATVTDPWTLSAASQQLSASAHLFEGSPR